MELKSTDAGRIAEGFTNEKQDCTVRALALCFELSYREAHAICASVGRKPRRGMYQPQIERAFKIASERTGATVEAIPVPQPECFLRTSTLYGTQRRVTRGGIQVGDFVRRLPKQGTYYLTSTRHAFTVKDGVVMDNVNPHNPRILQERARMEAAHKITPKASSLSQADINELWAKLQEVKKLYE